MSFSTTGCARRAPGHAVEAGGIGRPAEAEAEAGPTRRLLIGGAGALIATSLLGDASRLAAASPQALSVGTLEFGTVGWEIETIRARRLDAEQGLSIEPVTLASNEAGRVAFLGGGVDVIVSDLLFAARLRAEGRGIAYLPFSATEGAVMVPATSPIASVADLKGRSIGVAGGPLDKSWLLLQAFARKSAAMDLAAATQQAFGAPPLLTAKLEAGELDSALLFWNFCARLEAKGYRRLIGADEISRAFGFDRPIAFLGYIVSEAALQDKPDAVAGFAKASRAAKAILASDDAAWQAIRPLMQAPDDAAFATLRRRFVEGIPARPVAEERADAARLYAMLVELGGAKLVGPATTLPDGLYWTGA